MNETENDLWRVQLADGDMQVMTLDALDDAFQAGTIDESTLVLAPGATGWTKLADMAGLDDAAPAAPPTATSAPAAYSVNSLAPIAVDTAPASLVGMHQAQSLSDLADLDLLDENALKPKKGRVFAFIGAAVLVVGGLGFAATKLAPVTASAANAMQAEAQLKNAANAVSAPSDADSEASKRLQQLTEEQRVKLLEADKAREAAAALKAREKASHATTPARHGDPAPKSGQPFHNGGDKFDPLNGAL